MSTSVTISEYKNFIRLAAELKQSGVNLPLYVLGNAGLGKTQVTCETAHEINYDFVVLNLANQSPEELLGFPNDTKDGYKLPDWIRRNSSRPVVYFLDEINRAAPFVLQCMFNFINEGRIHNHFINPNDIIIAAGNPPSMDYEVTEFEDEAFLSRFAILYLEPSESEYVAYFNNTKGIHKSAAAAMKIIAKTDAFDASVSDQYKYKAKFTPRMLEKLGRFFDIKDENYIKQYGPSLCAACVGYDTGSIIMETWKNAIDILDAQDIIDGKAAIDKFDMNELDKVTIINNNLVKCMTEKYYNKDNGDILFSKVQKKNFVKWCDSAPKDSIFGMIKYIANGNPGTHVLIKIFGEKWLTEFMEVETTPTKK